MDYRKESQGIVTSWSSEVLGKLISPGLIGEGDIFGQHPSLTQRLARLPGLV